MNRVAFRRAKVLNKVIKSRKMRPQRATEPFNYTDVKIGSTLGCVTHPRPDQIRTSSSDSQHRDPFAALFSSKESLVPSFLLHKI